MLISQLNWQNFESRHHRPVIPQVLGGGRGGLCRGSGAVLGLALGLRRRRGRRELAPRRPGQQPRRRPAAPRSSLALSFAHIWTRPPVPRNFPSCLPPPRPSPGAGREEGVGQRRLLFSGAHGGPSRALSRSVSASAWPRPSRHPVSPPSPPRPTRSPDPTKSAWDPSSPVLGATAPPRSPKRHPPAAEPCGPRRRVPRRDGAEPGQAGAPAPRPPPR